MSSVTQRNSSGLKDHGSHSNMFTGSMAKSYNSRTGGCNIQLATHLISLAIPHLPSKKDVPLRILDNASGPLVLTAEILNTPAITSNYAPIHISATDISADFVKDNNSVIAANAATLSSDVVKVDSEVMNGMDMSCPDETFDASFTSLAIFGFPDPVKGARELYRTLKPNGVSLLTTWKDVGWIALLHEVERRIRSPGSPPTRFPIVEAWMIPGKLRDCLRDGGFERVEEGDVQAVAWFDSVEDMAKNLTATLKLMVGQAWTDEEKENMEGGLLDVLRERKERGTGDGLRFEDSGRTGSEMSAFTAVARK